jgi:predicted nuclease of predicted toxin-antitoxin system
VAPRSARDGVRLLLDEHISPTVAVELHRLEHDVDAVAERDDLRGRSDVEVFAEAAVERRTVVTFDVSDYLPLVHRSIQLGHRHGGLILLSSATSWTTGAATGRLVTALAALMLAHPADDAFTDRVAWLQPAEDQPSSQR